MATDAVPAEPPGVPPPAEPTVVVPPPKREDRTVRLIGFVPRLVSGLALFFMMILTVVDVVGRKFFNHSVFGGLEMTELGMLVLIFGALPIATLAGQQIIFDLFDSYLPRRLRHRQVILGNVLSALLLFAVAWFVLGKAGNTREMGDITAQLAITIAPFHYGAAVLVLLTALAHLYLAFTHKPTADPEADATASLM
ncbi:MAG: TRAP transporter small permease [Burkholderiaceae bacterium]